jgi:hypothetical protein
MNVWVYVLLEKYTHCHYVINNLERELNFSWSLKMNIVKMSLLTVLLAEKRERRNEEKKADPFTFSRPLTRARFFSLLLSYCMHGNDERSKKTSLYRASSDDAFLERECAPLFFCYVLKRTPLHTLFSYFFYARRLHSAAKTKESATSFSPSLPLVLAYTRNKSHLEFFFSRAISLTTKVYDKQRMASESKKRKELILCMIQ